MDTGEARADPAARERLQGPRAFVLAGPSCLAMAWQARGLTGLTVL